MLDGEQNAQNANGKRPLDDDAATPAPKRQRNGTRGNYTERQSKCLCAHINAAHNVEDCTKYLKLINEFNELKLASMGREMRW